MIRVAHFLDGIHFGGGEEAVVRLARAFDPKRVEALVVCMAEGRLTQRLAAQATPFVVIRRPRLAGLRAATDLAALIRRRGIDIVHSHTSRTHLIGRIAAWRTGAAHVATIQSPVRLDINDRAKRRWLPDAVDRIGQRWSARVIFVCEEERRRLVGRGLPQSKAVWIPNGVDLRPAPEPRRVAALRAKWGLEAGRPVAAMVAQLRPRKGPETLLRAIPALIRAIPQAVVVFVGDAEFVESRDYLSELRSLAERLGVEGHAKFVGFCDDAPAALALADVSVLPSRFGEGLPLVLLESMAAGIPIVTTDIPGNREAVRDGFNGLLVPPDDPEALGRALVRLLGDADLRSRMGAEGQRLGRELYDMRLIARRHEELYAAVAAEKKRA